MAEIRRFNEPGLAAARELLDSLRKGKAADIDALLENEEYTTLVAESVEYEVIDFEDRMHAAQFFFDLLTPLTEEHPDLELDAGLWSWLTFKWLPVLAPEDPTTGARTVRSTAYYILNPHDYKTYYRHYFSGPYRIYKAHQEHPEEAYGVLATPVNSPGEVVEQIASNQEIVSNSTLLGVVTRLYLDGKTKKLKRGSGGSKGGSPRRLAAVLAQFDLTWDTYAMTPDEIINLLPQEFAKFKS
ncbi:hypothetical protein AB0O52_14085 [Arthrobacter sp. NPDC080073]|uniref:hypothetical protein n=1 Tax=Arthrobacter sp. NPDC080073 TaxID=3155919 RepID=UPI00341A2134